MSAEGPSDDDKRPSGWSYKPEAEPIDLGGKPRWQYNREVIIEKRKALREAAKANEP